MVKPSDASGRYWVRNQSRILTTRWVSITSLLSLSLSLSLSLLHGYYYTVLDSSSDNWSACAYDCHVLEQIALRERNVLFNDALNTFYLRLYGVRHMVKDHSDSETGNPLPPHRLLFPINSKGSFICTIPQTG